jgi:hypothetical protein
LPASGIDSSPPHRRRVKIQGVKGIGKRKEGIGVRAQGSGAGIMGKEDIGNRKEEIENRSQRSEVGKSEGEKVRR